MTPPVTGALGAPKRQSFNTHGIWTNSELQVCRDWSARAVGIQTLKCRLSREHKDMGQVGDRSIDATTCLLPLWPPSLGHHFQCGG